MASILVNVFLIQLVLHIVNRVGGPALNDLLWSFYCALPTPIRDTAKQLKVAQRDVLKIKSQVNATSSQDEFAKWAKLNRQYDAAVTKYEKLNSLISVKKSVFSTTITIVRTVMLMGLRWLPGLWYSRKPMFWLPRGWVPGYLEWILALPKAPLGSVSVTFWALSCAAVIHFISVDIKEGVQLVRERRAVPTPATKVRQ